MTASQIGDFLIDIVYYRLKIEVSASTNSSGNITCSLFQPNLTVRVYWQNFCSHLKLYHLFCF